MKAETFLFFTIPLSDQDNCTKCAWHKCGQQGP